MKKETRNLMTEKQVAQYLSVSLATIRSWRASRINLPYVKLGNCVRYSIEDLEKYLASHTIKPVA